MELGVLYFARGGVMSRCLLIAFLLILAHPTVAQVTLQLESKHQRTFGPTEDLKPADIVRLEIKSGRKPERIRLHLCGPQCNTAQTIQVWETRSYTRSGTASFRIQQPGRYYLWVEDPNDKEVPIPLQSEQTGEELMLKYPSGLEIRARIARS
jgi:hypothetical protein